MKFSAVLILIFALIFESTITTIPLILISLLCFLVVFKDSSLFYLAFIFGLLFDLAAFKTPGLSSAYLVAFLFLVLLYQNKFEIATNSFILASSFLGSLGFLLIAGYNSSIIFESLLNSLFSLLLFVALTHFAKIGSNPPKNI